ncbi:MAG: hypothetical protein ACYCT1_08300 [Steroidobacteraceae bacterium]
MSGTLSPEEELLFIGLFSLADDEGRILADPIHLRGLLFRFRDSITTERTRQIRDRVVEVNPNVVLYHAAGHDYIWLRKWKEYQSPRYPRPSIYPPAPQEAPSSTKPSNDAAPGTSSESAATPTQSSGDHAATVQQDCAVGRDGMGRDGLIPSAPQTGGGAPPADPEVAAEVAAAGDGPSDAQAGDPPYWQAIEAEQPLAAAFCRGAGITTSKQAHDERVFAFVHGLENIHGEGKVMSACQALIRRGEQGNPPRDVRHARSYVVDRLRTPRGVIPPNPPAPAIPDGGAKGSAQLGEDAALVMGDGTRFKLAEVPRGRGKQW